MPITISTPGNYTVVQGETYIISPGVSGTVTFNAPTGSGTIDFSVESNQSATGNLTVNLNSTSAGMTMNPTVSVADGVDAGRVSFQAVGNNFGNLSYDIGDGAKIGAINSADGSLIGTNYAEVKTTITAGDNATIGSILGGTAASNVTLGDNVNITGGINGTYGGFTMETGSGFNYSGAEMNFRYSKADVSIDIGDNSNLHSQNVYMAESYINYSFSIGANSSAGNVEMGGGFGNHTVNVGNDTTIGHLLIGGSGPGIQQTVNLGDNVNTGDISIGGSGTAASPMVITINAGNGTHIGGTQFTAGNIGLGGTYIVRDITFGDDVTVEGLLGMGGSAGTNTVVIGDNYTQNGYFTGSLTGTETVTIGNNWKFSSTFDLQSGDDSLKLGYSDRNSGSYISGGGQYG
ncbi:hypothetical protein [Paracoccus sp. (in: a-proteobacteria)]|uniref:hypothetical protein n=1 Tax=Paracoccus sp. TaxID=267 RepID=UPI0028A290E2|nr:hypothetical protein [Paracoccus sp. (in: a-proteobacteria)]